MTRVKGKVYHIRWTTTTKCRKQISKFFNIDNLTINHTSRCFITEDKEEKFMEGIAKGFYRLLDKYK